MSASAPALAFSTALKFTHDMLAGDGWQNIRVQANSSEQFHLAMRYRNQLCLVFLDLEWSGKRLTPFDERCREYLLEKSVDFNAIPVLARFNIDGEIPVEARSVRDTFEARCLTFSSRSKCAFEDVQRGTELLVNAYDFEEQIPLSRWEVHDFGIQIVRQFLEKEGHRINYYDSNLGAAPQISAVIDGKPTNILVDTACHPKRETYFDPVLCRNIAIYSAEQNKDFKLAPVYLASPDDPFDPANPLAVPLYRGQAACVKFEGLIAPELSRDS